ncbi:hypothetical protein ncot_02110 [Nocardioides sp. JQ2195]|uniref:hypothetical protein n=1 Tax=Nocardioides sp. JQ2195 TaxID=2592334 RepID=UPI00143E1271|nr:hypothetical protein [Nocardioides sp. JQ2195]QIX25516.1 hypothetical protein ncot_02110 [Nocardioides sp. JQ2195]
MAGGWSRRSNHGTMAERVAATRRNAEGSAEAVEQNGTPVVEQSEERGRPSSPRTPEVTPPDLKHCWYAGPHGRQAALLLAWRQASPGAAWEGNIAVAAPDGDGWAIVTMWVGASMLRPATGQG